MEIQEISNTYFNKDITINSIYLGIYKNYDKKSKKYYCYKFNETSKKMEKKEKLE